MKGKNIIAILIIMNLLLLGSIYNLLKKVNLNNQKQIIKEMTETEYENYITEISASHEEYANYIDESKKKIASAITDMGVNTSDEESLETMASNIRSISTDKGISDEMINFEHVASYSTGLSENGYNIIESGIYLVQSYCENDIPSNYIYINDVAVNDTNWIRTEYRNDKILTKLLYINAGENIKVVARYAHVYKIISE